MRLHALDSKDAQRRLFLFVAIICAFIACGGVAMTDALLQSAQQDMRAAVERTLLERAQGEVSRLTAWSSAEFGHVDEFAKADLVRLFTYEVYKQQNSLGKLLRMVRSGPGASVGASDEMVQLARQFSPLGKSLDAFVLRYKYDGASLMTADMKPFLSSERGLPKLSPTQAEGARTVMQQGKRVLLPVERGQDGQLRMDILQPIFSPEYLEEGKQHITAIMLVKIDVSDIVSELSQNRGEGAVQAVHFLQMRRGVLYPFPKEPGVEEAPLSNWKLSSLGQLPFAQRALPNGEQVFLLGLPAPELPWVLVVDEPVALLQQAYEEYRTTALLVVIVGGTLLILGIGGAWWWLVGQREKAVSQHIHALSQQNRQQQELIENINSRLSDAIVLKDGAGKIHYCNTAYAAFLKQQPEELLGQNAERLFSGMSNLPINPHVKAVLETGTDTTYTEILQLDRRKHTYQVICSPFRSETSGKAGVLCVYRDITSLLAAQERAQNMAYQTIHVLVRAIETFDPYLAGQSMRTAELAQILARMLGLENVHVSTLRAAANLSQVGMLHVPAELRTKAGRLTPEERRQLQQHVVYARRMLEGIDFGFPVQDAIYQMYEAMDGSGYPKGLKGDAICIDARILAVANTFCALLRPRAYRQARSMEEALTILSLDAPAYDTAIVQTLHNFLRGPLGKKFVQTITDAE